ncbi:Spermidine Putrescine ABC transporter permease component potC (TC_3.A.1.11.1) [Hyphomicrobiales bacterium]|nr:Spermidine Putrescine ABC transporter permease component potC (TC_3.A.1.11.1) [Hyphomicrobiales bacterium]CAH1676858.1 Spermidine Putrescine ABC transporter permease component potC (TC_3.A.1.11.1) [Hyphomicrobiales bacterium]
MGSDALINPGLPVRIAAWVMLAFLMAPVLIIIPVSFSSAQYLSFPPPGFSLQWYERFFGNKDWLSAIWVSVQVATLSAGLTIVVSTLAAIPLVRSDFSRKTLVYGLLLAPMIVPVIITAIALYFVFARIGMGGTVIAIAIGHTVVVMPIAIVVLSATLQGVDSRLENAAMSLGASRFQAFRKVTLPLIAPGIISAGLFAFLTSFDELVIPLFLGGPNAQTLAVRIWNSVMLEIEPTIAAVSTFLIALTVMVMVAANLVKKARRWA